jgi:hypothetical protein
VVSELLRGLPSPWIYVVKFAALAVAFTGALLLWTFVAATPIAELDLGGKSLPGSWQLAIRDHDRYFEAFTIAGNPTRFGVGLLLVAVGLPGLVLAQRAIRRQIEAGGELRDRLDRKMNLTGLAITIAVGALVMNFLVVGTYPS